MPSFPFNGRYGNFSQILQEVLDHLDPTLHPRFFAGEQVRRTLIGRILRFQRAIEIDEIDPPSLDDWRYPIPIIAALYGTIIPPETIPTPPFTIRQLRQASFRERVNEMSQILMDMEEYVYTLPEETAADLSSRLDFRSTLYGVVTFIRQTQNQLLLDEEDKAPPSEIVVETPDPYISLDEFIELTDQ